MTNNTASSDAPTAASSGYTPRWISYASQILNGLFDGDRSASNDGTTHRIILTCLKTLAKGNALSEKQRAAFIDNIRIRLGKPDFTWEGAIQLTRSQKPAARELLARHDVRAERCSIDAGLEQDLGEQVAALTARIAYLEEAFAQILHDCGINPAPILLDSCSNPAEMTLRPADMQGLVDLTKRNGTKRNHDGDMTCLSGRVEPMSSSPSISGPPANDVLPSTSDIENNGHEQVRSPSANRAVVSYFRNDRSRSPSANLEIDGKRFSLVFHSADVAEEKLANISSKEWMRQLDAMGGKDLRAQSRAHAGSDRRYVMSPLYGERDRYGMKQPVVPNCVALLGWSEDGRPQSVVIIGDDDHVQIPLRPVEQTKPKGPVYKGSVKLAA